MATTTATTASSLSPSTSSSSSAPIPASTSFRIQLDTSLLSRKRSIYYVGFVNDTAVGFDDLNQAALFTIVDGYLRNDGLYVGSKATRGYETMRRYSDRQLVIPGWTLESDGSVSLDGQVFTLGDGSAQFCVSNSGAVVIQVTQESPGCIDAPLDVVVGELS